MVDRDLGGVDRRSGKDRRRAYGSDHLFKGAAERRSQLERRLGFNRSCMAFKLIRKRRHNVLFSSGRSSYHKNHTLFLW